MRNAAIQFILKSEVQLIQNVKYRSSTVFFYVNVINRIRLSAHGKVCFLKILSFKKENYSMFAIVFNI